MPQENMQDPQDPSQQNVNLPQEGGLSDDEAAAALGYITTLGQNQQMSMQAEQEPQEDGEQPETTEETPEETEDVDSKIGALKEEMQKMMQDEIGSLKEMIVSALNEDE